MQMHSIAQLITLLAIGAIAAPTPADHLAVQPEARALQDATAGNINVNARDLAATGTADIEARGSVDNAPRLTRRLFQCSICGKSVPDLKTLNQHTKAKHPKGK